MKTNFANMLMRGMATMLALGGTLSPARATAPATDQKGIEFFENRIRPIFANHCFKCHSHESEKPKGGLLLDSRDGVLKGGDSGPAIAPGDPNHSLLIKAVRYTDPDLKMPPKDQRLSAGQIADLEAWVRLGAPDPRTAAATKLTGFDAIMAKREKHWAFRPLTMPVIPKVKSPQWIKTPIDAFILARLEAKGMKPAPPTDQRTLIRRAAYDLTGLPPTPEEVSAFEQDRSPDAYRKLVDRLLESPHYGERWGRHWLDVARYADTKGYLAGGEQRRFAYSYTYRDYVIRALNEDLPYNRFILEQLAADQLPLGKDQRPLAGLGYLTLGRRFLNNVPDIIDDRIDVVGRGLLGLTIGCARCHDHKYDPIPTKDYYSLYGVFASSVEPSPEPLLGITPDPKNHAAYLAERKKREEELAKFRADRLAAALAAARRHSGDYLLAVHDTAKITDHRQATKLVQQRKLNETVAQRWRNSLAAWSKGKNPIFAPWFALAALPESEFAARAPEILTKLAADPSLNPLVFQALRTKPLASVQDVAARYGNLFEETEKQWHESQSRKDAGQPRALPDANWEALRQILYATDAPANVPPDQEASLLEGDAPRLRELQAKIDELDAVHPGAPPRATALADAPQPYNPRVFIRGNPGNPGPEVPRQFLEVLSGKGRRPFQHGSGRLELAQAIASPDNPLTARVLVNRVWREHFGQGLVSTPSDFGVRTDPPTHPELLDYLAATFIQEGWSLKKLHRAILLSATYRQTSDPPGAAARQNAKIDPGNRLLWRMNRHRLDFEALRDTLLQVGGTLDPTMGGQPVDLVSRPYPTRRTVYGFIDRQNLPGLFRTFDFASPDTSVGQRFTTTVPQQALFLINNPFVVEQAKQLLQRPAIAGAPNDADRLREMYRQAYQRLPAPDELKLALQFVRTAAPAPREQAQPVWLYGYGQYDPRLKRVLNFTPLPHWTGSEWQGGPKRPDPKIGWVILGPEGGHPGDNPNYMAIRRWVAPGTGTASITGTVRHGTQQGNGVHACVVSSRTGLLAEGVAYNGSAPLAAEPVMVQTGDTIDFVVDCRDDTNSDSFTWSPIVSLTPGDRGATKIWDAKKDFSGPAPKPPAPLDAWQKFAQVLLLSNELMFTD